MLYAGAATFEWEFYDPIAIELHRWRGSSGVDGVGSLYWRLTVGGRCCVIQWHVFCSVVAVVGGFWVVLWW